MFHSLRTRNRIRNLPSATSRVHTSWIAWMASVVVTRKAA